MLKMLKRLFLAKGDFKYKAYIIFKSLDYVLTYIYKMSVLSGNNWLPFAARKVKA